jgi:hypothetical protein
MAITYQNYYPRLRPNNAFQRTPLRVERDHGFLKGGSGSTVFSIPNAAHMSLGVRFLPVR